MNFFSYTEGERRKARRRELKRERVHTEINPAAIVLTGPMIEWMSRERAVGEFVEVAPHSERYAEVTFRKLGGLRRRFLLDHQAHPLSVSADGTARRRRRDWLLGRP
jgi:hypothetical protein